MASLSRNGRGDGLLVGGLGSQTRFRGLKGLDRWNVEEWAKGQVGTPKIRFFSDAVTYKLRQFIFSFYSVFVTLFI